MRVLAPCLLILTGSLSVAQTSQEFRSRYGAPYIEKFLARPGISLTAEYGSDGQICHLLIEPRQSLIHEEQQGVYMSSEAVTEILNEIVPLETRGKETLRAFTSRGGCNRYEFVEYENVSIGRATHNCLPLKSEREMSARVIFKRAICSNLSK